nr:hypothetical protein [Tanacetum cinerariifolium]
EVREYTVDTQVKERQADIYNIDMDHAAKVLSVAVVSETVSDAVVIPSAVLETISVAAAVPTVIAPPVKVIAPVKAVVPSTKQKKKEPKPMKKKQQVELDEAYARKLQEEINQDIDWEVAMDHVKQKAKEEPFIQRYQIVPDEDDDVFTEATPLTRKVPVMDYQVILVNNKPRYKIKKDDDTHQLYASFITMLKNFNREDLETLWKIVKERFSISKSNNFSDEYLLKALKTMFERPDGQDNVWSNQSTVHGQALVKNWKLLASCEVHIISFNTT